MQKHSILFRVFIKKGKLLNFLQFSSTQLWVTTVGWLNT